MTIVSKLRVESLRLRKERNPVAASITFVISEIDKIGKNNGNRVTTEDEAIKAVQKIVATLRENLKYKLTEADEAATYLQILILELVLPQMLSANETTDSIRAVMASNPTKGEAMKLLRAKHGALIDMKLASSILKDLYGV